jgi:antitoxin (DNA-binding transcriptional repressor) of toxin-antitoxin stability system
VRELRQHASRWLRRVEAGESFLITDRGHVVATLSPAAPDTWQRLVQSGRVTMPSRRLGDVEPLPNPEGVSVSALLQADRDDER